MGYVPVKLRAKHVEKPWGRTDIPSSLGGPNGQRVGEIWFSHPDALELPLLVKYILTSEKLSIQVHPTDADASTRGLVRGKTECWYIIAAEPGATLGIGLRSAVPHQELREAAVDGSIEQLLDWKPVSPGDFFFVPAGTVHAIGAGITLLEVQQSADVTYRLYDYGRPRELHLDDGIAVAKAGPYADRDWRPAGDPQDTVLLDGPHFSLVRATSVDAIPRSFASRLRWIMPLEGAAGSHAVQATAGECLLIEPEAPLALSSDALVLVAVEGFI